LTDAEQANYAHATGRESVMTSIPSPADFMLSGVSLRAATYLGQPAFEIRMPTSAYQDPARERLMGRAYMAWLPMEFGDGAIEVDVASDLASDAPTYARPDTAL